MDLEKYFAEDGSERYRLVHETVMCDFSRDQLVDEIAAIETTLAQKQLVLTMINEDRTGPVE